MADTKITGLLTPQVTTNPATDVLPIVNIADTLMAASGSTRKITVNQLLGSGGTATLASATITGDLTVATSVLKVDTANTRVGINTTSINGGPFNVKISPAIDAKFVVQDGFTTGNVRLAAVDNAYSTYKVMDYSALSHAWYNSGSPAMTLNSTGLGVGVASPGYKLDVVGSSASVLRLVNINNLSTDPAAVTRLSLDGQGATWHLDNERTNGIFKITRNSTACLTIDNSANVGIGVTPSAWNNNYNALDIGQNGTICGRLGTSNTVDIVSNGYRNSAGNWVYKLATSNTACRYQLDGSTGAHIWYSGAAGTAGNTIAGFSAGAMTLDASGRLLVGQTSTGLLNINGIDIEGGDSNGGSYIIVNHKLATASGQQYAFFGYNAVKTGDITQNGTTGVLYNTVSDYRLKESVQPLSNGLSRVSALKPSIYKWKSDGSSGEGFLAHELAEVVPFAVTGEKDALNEDGSIKAQSVDMSRVIPVLVAAIQELTARVQTLESK